MANCLHVRIAATEEQLKEAGILDPVVIARLTGNRAFLVESRKNGFYYLLDQITEMPVAAVPERFIRPLESTRRSGSM